jgi:hypothetical protein
MFHLITAKVKMDGERSENWPPRMEDETEKQEEGDG